MKTNDILYWMGPTVDDDAKSFEQNLYMKLDVRRRASTITKKNVWMQRKQRNETERKKENKIWM